MPTVPMPEKSPNENLLLLVAQAEHGGSVDEMLAHYATDSIVPGICLTCHGIEYSCEPDMEDGMCEESVCLNCVTTANPRRIANGLAPIVVHPNAYEPTDHP
jgi:hypothetical protein